MLEYNVDGMRKDQKEGEVWRGQKMSGKVWRGVEKTFDTSIGAFDLIGPPLKWFSSCLSNRTQIVVFGDVWGHPFMTSTKNHVFDPPPPVHMRPHGRTPTYGRPHTVDMKYTPLSSNGQYDDLPDLKLKFDYMILPYLNYTFSNLYH